MDVLVTLTLPTRMYESILRKPVSLLGISRAAVNDKLSKEQKNTAAVSDRGGAVGRSDRVRQPRLSIGTNFKSSGPM